MLTVLVIIIVVDQLLRLCVSCLYFEAVRTLLHACNLLLL
jgi:hypothetical protein